MYVLGGFATFPSHKLKLSPYYAQACASDPSCSAHLLIGLFLLKS